MAAEEEAAASGPGSGLQLPTFATARALVKPGSCLSVGPHRRHVALAPRFLDRKRSGLRAQLDGELLRYSESLRGVPVAYDNLKIVGELGDIYDDQGHVHLDVEADFVIFCPQKGQKLVGTVNKVAPSHLGCLVHGCFNASIPKPENMSMEHWQNLHFHVGDKLEFEVSRLDSDAAGVFCIRGKLIVSSLPPALSKRSGDAGDETDPGAGGEKPRKKNRKSLKQPHEDCGPPPTPVDVPSNGAGATETSPQVQEAVNRLGEEQEPRTKKKHHRGKLEQDLLWHASDSSGYQSDAQKKKKKRKKHSEESEGPEATEEPRPKKKKKKEKE